MNSFKENAYVRTETFALPNPETFVGLDNYLKGFTFGNYPFLKSVGYSAVITILSTALILVCTSMAAWYIVRVNSTICKIIYYMFVFSMVVPFQMVMFTLAKTADTLSLNTPFTIPVVYLGFGAGMATFMFTGFIKTLPLEIEEAAAIDGCGALRTFFLIILPMWTGKNLLWYHPSNVKTNHDLSRNPGDYVDLERLLITIPGIRSYPVHDNPDSHPVPPGKLRLN